MMKSHPLPGGILCFLLVLLLHWGQGSHEFNSAMFFSGNQLFFTSEANAEGDQSAQSPTVFARQGNLSLSKEKNEN